MITTPATSRRLGLLCGLLLGLALCLLLQPAGAYLCTEEPPAIRKKEGETCGGACFSEGLCEDGLVCGPSPEDDVFARDPANGKIKDFVDHILGRAAVGVCARAAPAARELRALPASGAADKPPAAGAGAPPCVGCPTGIDPTGEYVVQAAEAGVELMQAGGFFAGADEGERFELVRVVSGTSQVVSGIRYDLVIAVKRSSRPTAAPEYYRIDLISQPWVQPPYRLLAARPLTAQEAAEVEAAGAAAGKTKGKGGSKRGLLAAAGDAIRRAAARLQR